MKEKTKKLLVVAGLAVVCIVLVVGISLRLHKEDITPIPMETKEAADTEVIIDTEKPKPDTKELNIQPEKKVDVKEKEQDIQKEPVKTEKEKPKEAPELAEESDLENPAKEPEYKKEENKEEPAPKETTPKTGDTKDGMMYVEGFGWIQDQGEGTGINADDMYENGNKIGTMD